MPAAREICLAAVDRVTERALTWSASDAATPIPTCPGWSVHDLPTSRTSLQLSGPSRHRWTTTVTGCCAKSSPSSPQACRSGSRSGQPAAVASRSAAAQWGWLPPAPPLRVPDELSLFSPPRSDLAPPRQPVATRRTTTGSDERAVVRSRVDYRDTDGCQIPGVSPTPTRPCDTPTDGRPAGDHDLGQAHRHPPASRSRSSH